MLAVHRALCRIQAAGVFSGGALARKGQRDVLIWQGVAFRGGKLPQVVGALPQSQDGEGSVRADAQLVAALQGHLVGVPASAQWDRLLLAVLFPVKREGDAALGGKVALLAEVFCHVDAEGVAARHIPVGMILVVIVLRRRIIRRGRIVPVRRIIDLVVDACAVGDARSWRLVGHLSGVGHRQRPRCPAQLFQLLQALLGEGEQHAGAVGDRFLSPGVIGALDIGLAQRVGHRFQFLQFQSFRADILDHKVVQRVAAGKPWRLNSQPETDVVARAGDLGVGIFNIFPVAVDVADTDDALGQLAVAQRGLDVDFDLIFLILPRHRDQHRGLQVGEGDLLFFIFCAAHICLENQIESIVESPKFCLAARVCLFSRTTRELILQIFCFELCYLFGKCL